MEEWFLIYITNKIGFEIVKELKEEYLMVCKLY